MHGEHWTFEILCSKGSQKRKFEMLFDKSKKTPNAPCNWLINISSNGVGPHVCKLLEQGLKYAVTPMQIPVEN